MQNERERERERERNKKIDLRTYVKSIYLNTKLYNSMIKN